jgi:hypothetical protein
MKKKFLGVLLICLMAGSVLAAGPAWVGPIGNWTEAAKWNPAAVPSLADTNEIKDTVVSSQITVNTNVGLYTGAKITIGAGPAESQAAKLYVQPEGYIGSGTELKLSDTGAGGSGGKYGYLIQTGGTVDTGSAGKVEVGYKAGGIGSYTISGGSLIMTASNSTSQLIVGGSGAVGSTGTFDVIGTAPVITLNRLWVGAKDSSGGYNGTATMKLEASSPGSGVSSIKLTNAGTGVYIDPVNNAVANLDVTSLVVSSTALPSVIVLIETLGTAAVTGVFDSVLDGDSTGSGAQNSTVMLKDELNNLHQYTLTYLYNANGDGKTNDIALIIPEPATIALLSLGLIAIRRNKK